MSRKKPGHFCWSCRRKRPNERFSGRNHPRHLCRECARLPPEELEYRQGERSLEHLLHGGLYVPRRHRTEFNRFLEHPNARVRNLSRQILAEQRRDAEEGRRLRDEAEARATGSSEGFDRSREPSGAASDHEDDDPF